MVTATARKAFVYDGWNVIAEYSAAVPADPWARHSQNFWGFDLSGTLTSTAGVGGIGGLVRMEIIGPDGNWLELAPISDGNGNILQVLADRWVHGASTLGSIPRELGGIPSVASYEYGPFGEPLLTAGVLGKMIPFGYSTHRTDETGLLYGKHRYYRPSSGKWISRDPIGENGGANLQAYVTNEPVGSVDAFGLVECVAIEPFLEVGTGVADNATATDELGITQRSVKISRNAKAEARQHNNCACYYAVFSPPVKARALLGTKLPQIGVWRNGFIDGVTVAQVARHEYWHARIFVEYVERVWEPFEAWSATYRSAYFTTAKEALTAAAKDFVKAQQERILYENLYVRDRYTGHTGYFRVKMTQDDAAKYPGSNIFSVFRTLDGGDRGAQALALVSNYVPNYLQNPTVGNCP